MKNNEVEHKIKTKYRNQQNEKNPPHFWVLLLKNSHLPTKRMTFAREKSKWIEKVIRVGQPVLGFEMYQSVRGIQRKCKDDMEGRDAKNFFIMNCVAEGKVLKLFYNKILGVN